MARLTYRPLLATPRHLLRLLAIARTLARHDALFVFEWLPVTRSVARAARLFRCGRDRSVASEPPGVRLALALQRLGPSFIKLGQALSTRSDLVGEALARDLSTLQDRLPPYPTDEARAAIEAALEQDIDSLFTSFEAKPVAAASIAQVHYAVTREPDGSAGRAVAVKVLRPEIERAFERDLALFRWIAEVVERTQPKLRRLRPVETVETFAETVRLEMDLRLEAAAASELRENFRDDPTFRVPAPDWVRTGQRVLTTERVDGIPVHDVEALRAAGHDLEEIVRRAAAAFFNQVFRDGFFHGDMHPGNVFVDADGTLIAVDFGIMGRLDTATRDYLADMLLGFLTADYRRVADVHFRAGYVPAHKSREAFMQAARAIAEPIMGLPSGEISIARLLAQLFQVTEQFEMETQQQLLLLQKTMLLAEGVGRSLAPETNMWALAQPLAEVWMLEHRGPEARIHAGAKELADGMRRLPGLVTNLEQAARQIASGELRLDLHGSRNGRGGAAGWGWLAIAIGGAIVGAGLTVILLAL